MIHSEKAWHRDGKRTSSEAQFLHDVCGVYTATATVRRILDAVGWTSKARLLDSVLLEPSCGDGAFVLEAATRLVSSFKRHGAPLTVASLGPRIRSFELHAREAREARARVAERLVRTGLHHTTAIACARSWIKTGDFLLSAIPVRRFSHVVGNPPYVRWYRIPPRLKARYERRLSDDVIGGDLFIPFLDRALECLKPGGKCGILCSDRWRYMAFAEQFRRKWLPQLKIHSANSLRASDAFLEDVDSYPSILIASRTNGKIAQTAPKSAGTTLAHLNCDVRVGPALGCTSAFVLEPDEDDVEPELLHPWVAASDVLDGEVRQSGRRIVAMHDKDGRLIDLARFPLLRSRLERFRTNLTNRSVVRNGAPWYRPIDKVSAETWARPKILVPEMARTPRLAIDRTGAIPSHGVYAIFAPDDDIASILLRLGDGRLAKALEAVAPKVNGGYFRCYKRFLMTAPLPLLSPETHSA